MVGPDTVGREGNVTSSVFFPKSGWTPVMSFVALSLLWAALMYMAFSVCQVAPAGTLQTVASCHQNRSIKNNVSIYVFNIQLFIAKPALQMIPKGKGDCRSKIIVFITADILDAALPSLYFSGAYLRRRFKPQFSASWFWRKQRWRNPVFVYSFLLFNSQTSANSASKWCNGSEISVGTHIFEVIWLSLFISSHTG